jgi:O-antigen ligase
VFLLCCQLLHLKITIGMKINNLFSWGYILLACAMLAIGRVYDVRLEFFGINLALVMSIVYLLFSFLLIVSIKKVIITKSKVLLYGFYLSLIVVTPLFWIFYGVIEYGMLKYLNFCFIVIIMSIIILEKFNYKEVEQLIITLFFVSAFLAFLAVVGSSISSNADSGRLSVLGGGPIIFSRWMGLGILVLLLLPRFKKYKMRFLAVVVFFILSIASGSRGPVLTLLLVFSVYIVLNFTKFFFKFLIIISFLIGVIAFTNVGKEIAKVGKVDRILMNFSSRGIAMKSTGTREKLLKGALTVFQEYPLGVGSGNWQDKANELDTQYLMPLEYSHNIILEVLNEYGILIALMLVILFLYVFYSSYSLMRKYQANNSSLYPLLFYMLIFFFLNCLISGDLNDTRLLFVVISFVLIQKPLINNIEKC